MLAEKLAMKGFSRNSGQTLVEVVLAVAVASLILVGLTRATTEALRNAQFAKNQSLATQYAQEAMEIGLLNEIVPLEKLEDRTKEFANLIKQNSKKAISLAKELIHLGIYNSERGYQREGEAFQECFESVMPGRKIVCFIVKPLLQSFSSG